MSQPITISEEAREAAENIHSEYSTEWWKTLAKENPRYQSWYDSAQAKRDSIAEVIQLAIDKATEPFRGSEKWLNAAYQHRLELSLSLQKQLEQLQSEQLQSELKRLEDAIKLAGASAIFAREEQLHDENQKLLEENQRLSSFKFNDELQAENAKLKEEKASWRKLAIETEAEIESDGYRAQDKQIKELQQMVLEMRETIEIIGSQNHNLECPECCVCKAVDKALSLTTPLASNFIKREEFEKLLAVLRTCHAAYEESDKLLPNEFGHELSALSVAIEDAETVLKAHELEHSKA